jgi:C-terminal processing protease CtpA/Prc
LPPARTNVSHEQTKGYLKFNAFPSPRVCGETTTAAMTVLADCHALIIDLRDNSGGDPAMVGFVASYLFDAPVHLNDMHHGRTNATVQSWTTAVVPGRRFIGKPVFVVISPRTFSAAEEFTYALKVLGRATIVGEPSGGGAHAALSLRIDSHFHVAIPFARSINPISHSNWEGKGVEPDMSVRQDVAVHAAHRAALEGILKQSLTVMQREAVQRQIDALTAIIQPKR